MRAARRLTNDGVTTIAYLRSTYGDNFQSNQLVEVNAVEIGEKHMSEADITLGSNITVGKVILDPTEIKGVGGWHNPYLHIPIKIQLYASQKEECIAIIRLTASLQLTELQDITKQFGARVSYDLIYNLPNRSLDGTAPSEGGAQLLIGLTHEQIKQLEDLRHEPSSNLYLRLEPIIVRLRQTEEAYIALGNRQVNIGLQSDFAYLWLADIRALRIPMSEMKWAKKIYPGIGYDRFRLIEITLPSSSRFVPDGAIEMFEKARRDYDSIDYPGCVENCRHAIEAIEIHLSIPPHTHKLGDAVATVLGWNTDADQCKFLNQACKAYFGFTSAAHHYLGTISLLPADAHTALLSTATLLEYLGQLR